MDKATENVQWLLIGGPADGKTVWVKAGTSVRWRGSDGKDYKYRGQNYLEGGRMYRVGVTDQNDLLPSRVRDLIRSTNLQHIAGP